MYFIAANITLVKITTPTVRNDGLKSYKFVSGSASLSKIRNACANGILVVVPGQV